MVFWLPGGYTSFEPDGAALKGQVHAGTSPFGRDLEPELYLEGERYSAAGVLGLVEPIAGCEGNPSRTIPYPYLTPFKKKKINCVGYTLVRPAEKLGTYAHLPPTKALEFGRRRTRLHKRAQHQHSK